MTAKTYRISVEPIEVTTISEDSALRTFERMPKKDELVYEIEEVTK